MPTDVLILAAFEPEVAPLRALLGESLTATVGTLRVAARVAGIGLPAAAAGASVHIGQLEPRSVVLVGTCGAYVESGLAIGDVVTARRLKLVDPAALSGVAQFPEPMAIAAEADGPLSDAFVAAGLRAASVATTLAITVDDASAARIARSAVVDVEHLEAHGVAAACSARSVPFAAVLGVANFVGARGRAEWLAHHREAEAAAGACILQWLQEGARGIAPPAFGRA